MKTKIMTSALIVFLVLAIVLGVSVGAQANSRSAATTKISAPSFHDDMRKLWEDHITWTRLVIVAFAADLPELNLTLTRLLQNQVDIGNAVKPFYGEAAGNLLTSLLTDHIVVAAEVLAAVKSGNSTMINDALAKWYANAHDIAVFLNSANPKNWPLAEADQMMREHLDLTAAEAVAHLSGDFEASIAAYDEVHRQILMMADFLSNGIIRQFPSKFTELGNVVKSEEPHISEKLTFVAHLSGKTWASKVSNVTYTIETRAQGTAIFQFNKDATEIKFMLLVANIQNITMSHIHLDNGAAVGPIVVWLFPRTPPQTLIPGRFDGVLAKGTIANSDLVGLLAGMSIRDLQAKIEEGFAYVVVHTSQHPPGEIRAFIH